ncbi:MAG: hypothetical protein H6617_06025 [Bdellovibrionaceae bacterium]|nr:hypothetical protein [Bdellovibrionales bacterium]MCB9254221.1 hypothetical protein [Pseudobdellovibrionaceae bacterium]
MRKSLLSIGLVLFGFSSAAYSLPAEYDAVVKKLEEHSPQPRYSVKYLEFLHAFYEAKNSDPTPRLGQADPDSVVPSEPGTLAVLPQGVSRPEVPALPQGFDADFRENTEAQFKLAREMAQHAFIEVHHASLFASLPVAERQEALEDLYERWNDEGCKDTVFKPGNVERLLDFWVAVYEAECLSALENRVDESNLENPPLRGTWMAEFLDEVGSFPVAPVLATHRQRAVLTARESAAERFAEKYLDRYLAGATTEDARHVLSLLHLRLRDAVSQPKLTVWLVENAGTTAELVRALSIELWDSAFVSYSVAGHNESADDLAARLRDIRSNPFEHMRRGVGMESTFLAGLHVFLNTAVPRLRVDEEVLLAELVDALVADKGMLNYKVAAFIEAMQAYVENPAGAAHLPAIEGALRRLAGHLEQESFNQYAWQGSALEELQTALFHIIVLRKAWNAGTEASAVDMLAVLDNAHADPLDRAAAHYALGQFGPGVFSSLLDRRYAAPPTGGDAFARCVRALFEALEATPPPPEE